MDNYYGEIRRLTSTKIDDIINIAENENIQIRAINSSLILIKTSFSNLLFRIQFNPKLINDNYAINITDNNNNNNNNNNNLNDLNDEIIELIDKKNDLNDENNLIEGEKELNKENDEKILEDYEKEIEKNLQFTYQLEEINITEWENDIEVFAIINQFFPSLNNNLIDNATENDVINNNNNNNNDDNINNDNINNNNNNNINNEDNLLEINNEVNANIEIVNNNDDNNNENINNINYENKENNQEKEIEKEKDIDDIKKKIEMKLIELIYNHFTQFMSFYVVELPKEEVLL